MSTAADVVTSYTQTITNWHSTSNYHWLAKNHITLILSDDCSAQLTWNCGFMYLSWIRRCAETGVRWIITCGWRFGLFVLINTTIDRFYGSLPFISRQNWRTLCTRSPIHCTGAQFTHGKTVDIQLIDTSTHPYHSCPYFAITALRWNGLGIFTGTTNWVTVHRK